MHFVANATLYKKKILSAHEEFVCSAELDIGRNISRTVCVVN